MVEGRVEARAPPEANLSAKKAARRAASEGSIQPVEGFKAEIKAKSRGTEVPEQVAATPEYLSARRSAKRASRASTRRCRCARTTAF